MVKFIITQNGELINTDQVMFYKPYLNNDYYLAAYLQGYQHFDEDNNECIVILSNQCASKATIKSFILNNFIKLLKDDIIDFRKNISIN